jgi:hypothetical protein
LLLFSSWKKVREEDIHKSVQLLILKQLLVKIHGPASEEAEQRKDWNIYVTSPMGATDILTRGFNPLGKKYPARFQSFTCLRSMEISAGDKKGRS